MKWWKVVGAAAFVGVAATGVLVARAERRHHDYTPEEIHERLQARAAEVVLSEVPPGGVEAETDAPPSEPGAPPADVRRGLVTQVNRARTRLGLRRRPTPRRRAGAQV